ncbi:MAG: UPF0182 family protein [Caldilineaceae bacterium]|nr:UPF0182 family protein [Caldilineaceae bacterium]
MGKNDPFADLLSSLEENLQREGGWIPPNDPNQRRPVESGGNPRRILWFVIPIVLLVLFNRVITFYTDLLWYDSLNLSQVFITRLWAQFGLFAVGAVVFWLFLAINVWIAQRLSRRLPFGPGGRTPLEIFADGAGVRVATLIVGAGAILALFVGMSTSTQWEALLVYLNQHPFGLSDPLFNLDVSFFLFTLPIWLWARGWLIFLLAATLLAVALVSGLFWRGWRVQRPLLIHLAILGAILLALVAWQYRLDAFQLVYSRRGSFAGAGYTDVRAQLPVYNILFIVTLITAILLLVTAFLRQAWRAMVGVLGLWIVIAILAGNVYPGLVQRFQVNPNELNLERQYIENNIAFTRTAYDLDTIELRSYEISSDLRVDELLAEQETVRNIRLWDYRPLLQTYNQIQALRLYYQFHNIDVDRYEIDGELHQVMLGARELVPENLSQDAQTWVNRRLVYTHGYGVAASPVARVTRDGLPSFYVKDLPPQGIITVTQPQIYFGELTNEYVIARTEEPEFDYPRGEGNVTTRFEAESGIAMSTWARLLFAIHFADINILLNRDIDAESQLLWRRNIMERVNEVAPFLSYDQDPYIVVDNEGRLHWILDAYTVSNRFPYSEPAGSLNYIRNPVKVIVNAYDGTMRFYLMDPSEPIAAAYARIFPDLFVPLSDMPTDLRAHIRYPEDLFRVQAEVYRTYHMTDATEFYNREDLWAWPEEIFESSTVRMDPYYVLMQLPGSEELEYVQILPFTPTNRENMIAWMAARSDPDVYGGKVVYEFGADTLFFGPKQIEARIDQDPVIRSQLTLWNQQGSSPIRGNLLVIPVAGGLLYVEPLYLQSATGRIPELQRVIVATVDKVVMAENLGLALVDLFGEDLLAEPVFAELATFGNETAPAVVTSGAGGETGTAPATVGELVAQANEQFEQAQTYAREGNWAGYGEEVAALEATLARLAELTGVELEPTPMPTLEASPAVTATDALEE